MKELPENPKTENLYASLKIGKAHLQAVKSLSQNFTILRAMNATSATAKGSAPILGTIVESVGDLATISEHDDENLMHDVVQMLLRLRSLKNGIDSNQRVNGSELLFDPLPGDSSANGGSRDFREQYKNFLDNPFPEIKFSSPDELAANYVAHAAQIEAGLLNTDLDQKPEEMGYTSGVQTLTSYLRQVSHQVVISAVTARNALFIEILGALFKVNKHLVPTDISFNFHEIIDIGNWDDFIEYSFAKYINTISWRGGLESQLKFFSSSINSPISLQTSDRILCDQTEAYRHAIVHGSVINETLQRKIPTEDSELGAPIDLSMNYLEQLFTANIHLMNQMAVSATRYLETPGALLNYAYAPTEE